MHITPVKNRLREYIPVAKGSQDADSRNLSLNFVLNTVLYRGRREVTKGGKIAFLDELLLASKFSIELDRERERGGRGGQHMEEHVVDVNCFSHVSERVLSSLDRSFIR